MGRFLSGQGPPEVGSLGKVGREARAPSQAGSGQGGARWRDSCLCQGVWGARGSTKAHSQFQR
eukprot:11158518-Lingulodinium_polyedra.AAC.1